MNTDLQIINALDYEGGIQQTIAFYHAAWGNDSNFAFFEDAFLHSTKTGTGLPRFFVLLKKGKIIGCCGLITNDLNSRQDLFPWIAGVFVAEEERGNGFGNLMMEHAQAEARKIGYDRLYLTTDLDGYYERYGWQRMEDCYSFSGDAWKIYKKQL